MISLCLFSFRFRNCFFLAILFLSTSLIAQQPSKTTTNLGAVKPAIVASTSKLSQFVERASYLLQKSGKPDIATDIDKIYQLMSKGLDSNRPMGLALMLPANEAPEIVILLPLSNIDSFLNAMDKSRLGGWVGLGGGTYSIRLKYRQYHVYAKTSNDWLVVGITKNSVSRNVNDIPNMFRKLSTRYDLGVQVDLTVVPSPILNAILDSFSTDVEKKMVVTHAKKLKEIEAEERNAMTDSEKLAASTRRTSNELIRESLKKRLDAAIESLKNSEQIITGLSCDPRKREVSLDYAAKFVQGSGIDLHFSKVASSKSILSSVVQPDQAIQLSRIATVTDKDLYWQNIEKTFDTFGWKYKWNPLCINEVTKFYEELKIAFLDGVKEDTSDSTVSVSFEPGLNVLYARRLADSTSIEAALRLAIESIKQDPNLSVIRNESYVYQGIPVRVAAIRASDTAEPETVKMFSEFTTIAFASRSNVLYFAIGGQSEERLKIFLNREEVPPATDNPCFDLKFGLGAVVNYIHSIGPYSSSEAMLAALYPSTEKDLIAMTAKIIPHGVFFYSIVSEAALKPIVVGAEELLRYDN